jgi:hypothetical protein
MPLLCVNVHEEFSNEPDPENVPRLSVVMSNLAFPKLNAFNFQILGYMHINPVLKMRTHCCIIS